MRFSRNDPHGSQCCNVARRHSLPLLSVHHWKLEASSVSPLKLIKQLSFSTNFRPIFVHVPRALAYLPHGRRRVAQTPPQVDETAPLPAVRKFPARGKQRTWLCPSLDPRVQNFPPTRRDDSGVVVNSGLMIVTRSRLSLFLHDV